MQMANPEKIAWCLGSDGAQQEGNDSEAARLGVCVWRVVCGV